MNPEELTAILRASGEIAESERVTAVETTREYSCTHLLTHLQLTVEDEAHCHRTTGLVLKRSAPGQTSGEPEVEFYRRVPPRTDPALLVRCHYGTFCKETKTFSLLLEDLSPEWTSASTDVLQAPPRQITTVLLETLRSFHAGWWNAAELETAEFRRRSCTEDAIRAWMLRRDEALNGIVPEWRSLLTEEVSVRYGELLAVLPGRMASRMAENRHQTLIHGDAHGGNFLVQGENPRTAKLLDWPNWRPGLPTDDVAYLVGAWPEEAQCDCLEHLIPEHYRSLVAELGASASDYTWNCWRSDFVLSAGWTLVYAVGLLAEAPREWSLPVTTRAATLHASAMKMGAKTTARSA